MRKIVLAALLAGAAVPSFAKDAEIKGTPTQAEFQSYAQDFVAAISHRSAGPAEATGLTGFGIGAVVSFVPVDDQAWLAVTGEDFSGVTLAGVQVTKGLPLDLDVGAFYASMPGTGATVYGGEIRYAILPGSVALPALAVRGAYSTTSGLDTVQVTSKSIGLSLSKGFAFVTPYAGIGYVSGDADPDASTGLTKAEVKGTKVDVGARLSLGVLEFTPEYASVDGTATYSARFGLSFGLGV